MLVDACILHTRIVRPSRSVSKTNNETHVQNPARLGNESSENL
jgi:hypothetical protein